MMASKGWKVSASVVKPHVPLIKFRKGGIQKDTTSNPPSKHLDSAMLEQNNPSATGPNVVVLPTIEDLYLPARFQRRPIDEKEIAYINRGGPE
ncbi:28S ribosomal protein S36 [Apis cerana cerana]|uniref:28S ribosomal protein S36 n=1 Tax=Apis cerana cerana TaxID=94128 RepID=A0A2A3EH50_APICC|nr:28S ribosomal protein S36 [Apis cerana cerana]